MASTLLKTVTGVAAGRWYEAVLIGFAIVAGLVVGAVIAAVALWLLGWFRSPTYPSPRMP